MRRLLTLSVAAFILMVALLTASAQMRGGGRGGHGGFAGRGSFGGHLSGGHSFGGMSSGRSFAGQNFQSRGSHHSTSFHQSNSFRGDRFRGRRFRDRQFHNFGFANCFGCRSWWGWPGYAGYYDPFWYWDSHSSYDEDREREVRLADEMNARSLEQQKRMHESEDQDLYARSDARTERDTESTEEQQPVTVLVFRDRHQQEVQNYAIVGQTLWNFASKRTLKIALSELDLTATTKANDERGVDFKVPGVGEGQ